MSRLHGNLRKAGIDSAIMSVDPPGSDAHRYTVPRWRIAEGALRRITAPLGLNDIHRISSFTLARHPAVREADVLHFHGVHSGFLSYLALPSITRDRPAVFTLHDMWALTGHCAITYGCERWRTGCGACPHPDAHPRIDRDSTRLEWRLKRRAFGGSNVVFVSISRRMAEDANESLPRQLPVCWIPNGVDTEVFAPRPPAEARRILGIPQDGYVIMSSAVDFRQRHKGLDLLVDAVNLLPDRLKDRSCLLLVGGGGGTPDRIADIPAVDLGRVHERERMALAYNAADVFVLPSRYEPFGLVLIEGMACGTPLVAFDVGGVSDVLQTGVNGELVPPGDTQLMSDAIAGILSAASRRQEMGRMGRKIAVENFAVELETARYSALYKQVLDPTNDFNAPDFARRSICEPLPLSGPGAQPG